MAGLCAPLSTLRRCPRGQLRMTRGRCGSLLLHRDGLAPSTPCRSPGALRCAPISGLYLGPSACLKRATRDSCTAANSIPIRSRAGVSISFKWQRFRPLEVCLVVPPSQSIHTRGGVLLECVEYLFEQVDVDVLEERGEPLLLPFPCNFPYALQRLRCVRLPHSSRHRRPFRFVRQFHRCRVGGGALNCSCAGLRPPHKLDVQFSRIQLS